MSDDPRPAIAIGHLSLEVDDVPATSAFFVSVGIRPIVTKDRFAVLELRGGTHLVLRAGAVSGQKVPFDIMVDDVEAAMARYAEQGLEVSALRRGKIHDGFDVRIPDGRWLEVNSSHAGDRPV